MGVLGDSWCFCNGGAKSERMKAAIFSGKAAAMARINGGGTGFLIHRNLLLTTHANLPSVAATEAAEIRLHNGLCARLFPHRFYISSSVLDLTIVGLDGFDGESHTAVPVQQPHYLKACSKSNLELGSVVYLFGYTDKLELTVGEGKVVIATDNLIKLSTDGVTWSPGSSGFDVHGNLAFIVCDPMKLATSSNTRSSSTSTSSTSSWKRDFPMQFGIPIPIILDWLNQHWEGSLDELNKPKLPLMRLMSTGQKSDHSCASFTMRKVFKSTEGGNEGMSTSSRLIEQPGLSSGALDDDDLTGGDPQGATHEPGIPTPEIYESPMLTSVPVARRDVTRVQLLDIDLPRRRTTDAALLSVCDRNHVEHSSLQNHAESTGSVNGAQSEVQSTPVVVRDVQHEYSSDGETTMYSAETAESRNIPSPREGRLNRVGRSQSCVNHNRWEGVRRSSVARGATLEKHQSFTQGRSQGATSQRSNDYFSPMLSSIMKKRNNMEQHQSRPQQTSIHTSPRWMF